MSAEMSTCSSCRRVDTFIFGLCRTLVVIFSFGKRLKAERQRLRGLV